jgi:hypothetical protein
MFKMLMAILEDHPAEYLDFIQPTVELAYFYGFTADGNAVVFERFLIQLFNLTKLILICPQYKLPRTNGPICQMDGKIFYFQNIKYTNMMCEQIAFIKH